MHSASFLVTSLSDYRLPYFFAVALIFSTLLIFIWTITFYSQTFHNPLSFLFLI